MGREVFIGGEVSVGGKEVGVKSVGTCGVNVIVGIASCVSMIDVFTIFIAVSATSVAFIEVGDAKLLQENRKTATRNNGIIVLPMIFTFPLPFLFFRVRRPTASVTGGWRDETRSRNGKTQSHGQSHFGGVNPAVRVHALLGAILR
jgi:hypothetical protein